jgi:shikimate kinase
MILKLKRNPGIYLVGFMGSGKSVVGKALADQLGWHFSDLDAEIEERAKTSVAQIFDTQGEDAFRAMETAALRERVHNVQMGKPHVVSLGGGAFLSEENYQLVANHGVSVWLDCPLSIIERRVAGAETRPLARDPAQLRALFEARRGGYSRSDYRIEVTDDNVQTTVDRILGIPLF